MYALKCFLRVESRYVFCVWIIKYALDNFKKLWYTILKRRAEENRMSERVNTPEEGKQTTKQLFWEIVRFLLVGGGATVCDYFVFWMLDGVVFPLVPVSNELWPLLALWIATGGGFIVGMLVNWVLSVKFVFRSSNNQVQVQSKKPFWIFVVISLIGLFLTLIGVWGLSEVLPALTLFGTTHLFGTAWDKWLAKVVMTCLVLIWNYLGRKLFIFK